MSTQLKGHKTFFLPFNKDIENPVNPNGFQTHYLWEEVLQSESLLDLIENFVHIRTEKSKEYDNNQQRIVETKKDVLIIALKSGQILEISLPELPKLEQ